MTAHSENSCCNQTLQYTMARNLDKAAGGIDGGDGDVNEISRVLLAILFI